MSTRLEGLEWFRHHRSWLSNELVAVSKLYSGTECWNGKEAWWFEFELTKVQAHENDWLNLLCSNPGSDPEYFHLRLPMSLFLTHRDQFDFRENLQRFSLILSAERENWLQEMRGQGHYDFSPYLVDGQNEVSNPTEGN